MHENSAWDYELIEDLSGIDELALEIMGSRQEILLVEGKSEGSIDRKLYERLYGSYNIIPLESCQSVIRVTKAYRSTPGLNYVSVTGIVDRDRRSDDEVARLQEQGIYVLGVAEVENLFLLPEVIQFMAKKLGREDEAPNILDRVKNKAFQFLQEHLNEQALLFTKQRCQNEIERLLNEPASTATAYAEQIDRMPRLVNCDNYYAEIRARLQKILDDRDYLMALRVINNKGLLPFTNVSGEFEWRKDTYINQVLRFLDGKGEEEQQLKTAIKAYVHLPEPAECR